MKNDLISARIHVRLYCSTVSTEHDMSGMLYDDCIIKILGGKKIGEVSQPAYWLAFPFYWVSHHYKSNSNSHGLMMLLNYLGATSEYCQCFMSWVLCKKKWGVCFTSEVRLALEQDKDFLRFCGCILWSSPVLAEWLHALCLSFLISAGSGIPSREEGSRAYLPVTSTKLPGYLCKNSIVFLWVL